MPPQAVMVSVQVSIPAHLNPSPALAQPPTHPYICVMYGIMEPAGASPWHGRVRSKIKKADESGLISGTS